jgi:hypothetical protein
MVIAKAYARRLAEARHTRLVRRAAQHVGSAQHQGRAKRSNGYITVQLDRASAGRADGVTIDFIEAEGSAGFKIDNQPPALVKGRSTGAAPCRCLPADLIHAEGVSPRTLRRAIPR